MLIIVLKLYKINISYKAYSQAVYAEMEDFLHTEYRLNHNLYISSGIRGVGICRSRSSFKPPCFPMNSK